MKKEETKDNKSVNFHTRSIKIAPNKVKKTLSFIRGKTYLEAKDFLHQIKGNNEQLIVSGIILRALASAVTSANFILPEKTIIYEIYINQAPMLKRTQPRARGKAYRIEKKSSHLTIKLKQI